MRVRAALDDDTWHGCRQNHINIYLYQTLECQCHALDPQTIQCSRHTWISRVQNTLAKIVLNNYHYHPPPLSANFIGSLLSNASTQNRYLNLPYSPIWFPSYLSPLINLNAPSRLLRSSSNNLLHFPFTTTAIGRKAFSFAAPTVWNSIPLSIRQSPFIGSFKRHLKTHLFTLPG